MHGIPWLLTIGKIYLTLTGKIGRNGVGLTIRKKGTGDMEGSVDKFFIPDELVVDQFSSTSANAKACLKLPRHPHFLGCKVGVDCSAERTETLVELKNEKS